MIYVIFPVFSFRSNTPASETDHTKRGKPGFKTLAEMDAQKL